MADNQFLELLNADIQTGSRLLELLELEFAALGERKLELLKSLLDEKQPLLIELDQHARVRSQLLAASGHAANQEGFISFATNSPLQEPLQAQHQHLKSLIEQCQAANLRNGRLIRANQSSVGQALQILRGQDGPALYDNRGSTARKTGYGTLTRA